MHAAATVAVVEAAAAAFRWQEETTMRTGETQGMSIQQPRLSYFHYGIFIEINRNRRAGESLRLVSRSEGSTLHINESSSIHVRGVCIVERLGTSGGCRVAARICVGEWADTNVARIHQTGND